MSLFDPQLDLSFERVVDIPKEKIWTAWTEPQHVLPWFCPLPWRTIACHIDLVPGGVFQTTMQSPEGEEFPNLGTYLDIVENRRLVWTNALLPGYRPQLFGPGNGQSCGDFAFTAIIQLSDHPQGTLYQATVLHADAAGCEQHAAMGFEEGWGKALEQLVAYVKTW